MPKPIIEKISLDADVEPFVTDEMLDKCRQSLDFHLCEITLTVAVPSSDVYVGETAAAIERQMHTDAVGEVLAAVRATDIQILGCKSRALRLT